MERAIFGVLVQMTGNLEQVGDLAESYEVSDDATTFTFHIHPDATFNDGTPLTSEDVVFTLIKDGDHRLSRPQDIARLIGAVEEVA